MDVLKIAFLNGAALEFLAALCIALTAVYLGFGLMGILPWQKNEIAVPYFGALFILLLAPEFYAPLRQLGADYHAKSQAEGAVKSLLPILQASGHADYGDPALPQAEPYHHLAPEPEPEPEPKITASLVELSGKLSAKPSSDSYSQPFAQPFAIRAEQFGMTGLEQRVRLAPISFHVPAGHRIAITGNSGSGKSSLLQALMGFAVQANEVTGSLTLQTSQGDFKVAQLAKLGLLSAYRDQIGYLSQQVALMPMSIADNLRLAKPDATDDELWAVLESVQLATLLRQLPKGLDTPLGERGQGLSGGQQQRLGIAQLLLQDAQLWLLDEPTEHLDPDTAEAIHAVLQQVSVGKTILWVTHHQEQLAWLDDLIHINAPTQQNHVQKNHANGNTVNGSTDNASSTAIHHSSDSHSSINQNSINQSSINHNSNNHSSSMVSDVANQVTTGERL